MNYINVTLIGLFWTCYGIAGLFGYQFVPQCYRGKSWTKEYLCFRGLSWIFMGVPMMVLSAAFAYYEVHSFAIIMLTLLCCALPSAVYTCVEEKKYRVLLEEEQAGGVHIRPL